MVSVQALSADGLFHKCDTVTVVPNKSDSDVIFCLQA